MACIFRRTEWVRLALLIVCAAAAWCAAGHAFAQPFGLSRQAPPAEIGPFAGWILSKQAEFYRMLSATIRAAKADGTAAYTLLGISFVYGVFHAAGPGHGKAVISSYLIANEETWRRGVLLSFASALFQALTAIVIVAVAAVLLNTTAKTMGNTVRVVEIAGYALIVLIGLRLLWAKGRALLKLLRVPARIDRAHSFSHHQHHDHARRDHAHGDCNAGCTHEPATCNHAHAPEPTALSGEHWLRRGLAAIVAVGLRPCSGAILVLVFALAQGLFWTGVAATFAMGLGTALTVAAIATVAVAARNFAGRVAKSEARSGVLIVCGLEAAAALVIVLFGVLLLTGYMASERMIGV